MLYWIFNEIVIQGDEVHWADVAGLEVAAKKALKEAVVSFTLSYAQISSWVSVKPARGNVTLRASWNRKNLANDCTRDPKRSGAEYSRPART